MTSQAANETALDSLATDRCREALSRLRVGPVSTRTVQTDVRRILGGRGLITEQTEGQLELTARGRGVDARTFEA